MKLRGLFSFKFIHRETAREIERERETAKTIMWCIRITVYENVYYKWMCAFVKCVRTYNFLSDSKDYFYTQTNVYM